MPATDAQIAANRKNSLHSTGPRSDEGKERSRANSLKHGLTGEGVVMSDADTAEVALRVRQLEIELKPSGMASRLSLRRFAYLSVRLEKCERLDTAVYARRIRHAKDDFEDHRMTQVEALAERLNFDTLTTIRRLQTTPEGVDYVIGLWLDLRKDLLNRGRDAWTSHHRHRMDHLMGIPEMNFKITRAQILTEASSGYFGNLETTEGEGLNDQDRAEWARMELVRIMDEEVARLEVVKVSLNPQIIEQDKLEAPERALFDIQHAMNQVRKYEAATGTSYVQGYEGVPHPGRRDQGQPGRRSN